MIEVIIIAALVMWSALVVFKKVFPRSANSVFLQLSTLCHQQGWLTLAKWFTPKAVAGWGGGCSCPASEDQAKKTAPLQAVKWK